MPNMGVEDILQNIVGIILQVKSLQLLIMLC